MASLAEIAIKKVLEHEGGYANDPVDPGGETLYGISRKAHPPEQGELQRRFWEIVDHRKAEGLSPECPEAMEIAKQLYKLIYWDTCRCDDLPPALAVMTMDAAVQHGYKERQDDAPAMLQRAIGSIPDGKIGPKTIEAAQKIDTAKALRNLFTERAIHYSNNRNWTVYKQGWMKRLGDQMIFACSFLN
jgi:lysozyme family protein